MVASLVRKVARPPTVHATKEKGTKNEDFEKTTKKTPTMISCCRVADYSVSMLRFATDFTSSVPRRSSLSLCPLSKVNILPGGSFPHRIATTLTWSFTYIWEGEAEKIHCLIDPNKNAINVENENTETYQRKKYKSP